MRFNNGNGNNYGCFRFIIAYNIYIYIIYILLCNKFIFTILPVGGTGHVPTFVVDLTLTTDKLIIPIGSIGQTL